MIRKLKQESVLSVVKARQIGLTEEYADDAEGGEQESKGST
jgi:hypothetical protein